MIPGASLIAMLVGVFYPSIESYKALGTESKDDDAQWLAYWIIWSLFTVVEYFLDLIICWIPLYYEAKLIFVLWLALPQTRGALVLWTKYKNEIDKVYKLAVDQLNKLQKDGIEKAKEVASKVTAKPAKAD